MPGEAYTAREVRQLVQEGAQLVDVLSPEEYEADHIPGAVNIPLKRLDRRTAAGLDIHRLVIVYCNDFA